MSLCGRYGRLGTVGKGMGDTSLLVTRNVISHYDSMSLRLRDCREMILLVGGEGHGSGLYRGCGIKGISDADAYAAEQTGLSHMTKFASISPMWGKVY